MKAHYWFLLLVLLFIGGCQSTPSTTKKTSQILRTCMEVDISSFDPRKGVNMQTQGVLRMLFRGLVELDNNLTPSFELADSYTTSNNYKIYTFNLKKCFWSDGSPITAYDFEESWKGALRPAYSSACTNLFFHIKNGKKVFLQQLPPDELGVKAIDERTLVIELELPNAHFLNILINSIFYPVHKTNRDTSPNASNLICSGPFLIKKYAFQDQVILHKNPYYCKASEITLDELHYYIIKDTTTALLMFEKKEIDWLGEPLSKILPESIPALKHKNILQTFYPAGSQWMFLNTDKFPLNNAHIRKALALAIDRHTIMKEQLHLDEGIPTLGLIPKIVKKERWHPWFMDNDIQKAKSHFEKGLKELGLTLATFPPITVSYGAAFINDKILQAIQQMWRRNLGIEIRLEGVDGPILFSKWYHHQYDIVWLKWVLQYNDPVNMLEIFKYKNTQPNHSGWENPLFIEHATASLVSTSEEARWKHMEAAEQLFIKEMPSIPMTDAVAFYIAQPYIQGVRINHLYQICFDHAKVDAELKAALRGH